MKARCPYCEEKTEHQQFGDINDDWSVEMICQSCGSISTIQLMEVEEEEE